MVFTFGELWKAHSEAGAIARGEQVIVTAIDGLLLKVRRADASEVQAATPESTSVMARPDGTQVSRLEAD